MLFDTSILLRAWGFADDPMTALCQGLFETACKHGRTVVVAAPSVAEICSSLCTSKFSGREPKFSWLANVADDSWVKLPEISACPPGMAELTDGAEMEVHIPSDFPDPGRIREIREPMIEASILTPKEYIGPIMELCIERRGTHKGMHFLTADRVQLTYDLPLAEIVIDFFDALKSRTRGYASLDYELGGMVVSDMVKLDILLGGEQVDVGAAGDDGGDGPARDRRGDRRGLAGVHGSLLGTALGRGLLELQPVGHGPQQGRSPSQDAAVVRRRGRAAIGRR